MLVLIFKVGEIEVGRCEIPITNFGNPLAARTVREEHVVQLDKQNLLLALNPE